MQRSRNPSDAALFDRAKTGETRDDELFVEGESIVSMNISAKMTSSAYSKVG